MPAQEVELVADGALEAFAHVDVEVAERVGAHLGPARRVPRRLVDPDGGATGSRSAIWKSVGQGRSAARVSGRLRAAPRAARAQNSLRNVGPAMARKRGSASAVVIAASE